MRRSLAGLAFSVVLASLPGVSQAQSVAIGFGTLGANTQVGFDVGDRWGVRLDGSYFSFSRGVQGDNVRYDGDLRLMTIGALADLYPFDSGLRVSAGGYFNRNRVILDATPTGNVEIGNAFYTPAQVGALHGRAAFPDFAPYAGLGWSGNRGGQGLAFIFDGGVLFQRGSNVTLTSSGPLASNAAFAADLERERQAIKDDVDDFRFYPVVKIGLAYRF